MSSHKKRRSSMRLKTLHKQACMRQLLDSSTIETPRTLMFQIANKAAPCTPSLAIDCTLVEPRYLSNNESDIIQNSASSEVDSFLHPAHVLALKNPVEANSSNDRHSMLTRRRTRGLQLTLDKSSEFEKERANSSKAWQTSQLACGTNFVGDEDISGISTRRQTASGELSTGRKAPSSEQSTRRKTPLQEKSSRRQTPELSTLKKIPSSGNLSVHVESVQKTEKEPLCTVSSASIELSSSMSATESCKKRTSPYNKLKLPQPTHSILLVPENQTVVESSAVLVNSDSDNNHMSIQLANEPGQDVPLTKEPVSVPQPALVLLGSYGSVMSINAPHNLSSCDYSQNSGIVSTQPPMDVEDNCELTSSVQPLPVADTLLTSSLSSVVVAPGDDRKITADGSVHEVYACQFTEAQVDSAAGVSAAAELSTGDVHHPDLDRISVDARGDTQNSIEMMDETPSVVRLPKTPKLPRYSSTPLSTKRPWVPSNTEHAAPVKRSTSDCPRQYRPTTTRSKPSTERPLITAALKFFSGAKTLSSSAIDTVEQITQHFWSNLASQLHGRKHFDRSDMEMMMKRHGLITSECSLEMLIEKYLPLELRQELLPVARSANRIEILRFR